MAEKAEAKEQLLEAIEIKRSEMLKAATIFGLCSPETIKISQEVDEMVYQCLILAE